MEIKVPFLKEAVGAGDVVKAATSAVGVKPCTPCEERRKRMNGALQFVPRETWTAPPAVPEGWVQEASFEIQGRGLRLFRKQNNGQLIIWHVIEGRYERSHTFCCGDEMRPLAQDKWEQLCHSL
jgi:hypothetical protein